MQKPESCKQCPFCSRTYVPAVGSILSPIAIIGEAPGAQEEIERLPFVGGAGKILNMLTSGAGISREACYVTNVLKCRPDGNDIRSAGQALYHCSRLFAEELKTLGSRVLVPLGNTAVQALGLPHNIGKIRGSVLIQNNRKIIPTWHPAYIMRQFHEFVTAQYDWRKIRRHIETTAVLVESREDFSINPTLAQLEEFIWRLELQQSRQGQMALGIDIETFFVDNPMQTPLKMIGFSISDERVMVVPFIKQDGSQYWGSVAEAARAMQLVARILENPRFTKVFHHSLFDCLILMNIGLKIVGPIFDTLIAHLLIYFPVAHTLAYVVSVYADYPAWKLYKGNSDTQYRIYNARDCAVLQMILEPIKTDLQDNNLDNLFMNLMDVILPTCQMVLNGLYVSPDEQENARRSLDDDLNDYKQSLCELSGEKDFNPRSIQQVATILFDKFKMVTKTRKKQSDRSTSIDVLNKLAVKYPENEFLKELLNYKKMQKLFSTYSDPPILSDKRVHSLFSLNSSSGEYKMSNPVHVKKMYCPKEGWRFLSVSLSEADLSVFSVLTQDEIWIDAFKTGKNIDVVNGETLLGKHVKEYQTFIAGLVSGLMYGSDGLEFERFAPKELIREFPIGRIISSFRSAHPGTFLYRDKVEQSIRLTRKVTNPFGRTQFFVNTPSKSDIKDGYEYPIRSSVSDILHVKTGIFSKELDLSLDKWVMQDDGVNFFEVREDRVEDVARVLKTVMEIPVCAPNGMVFYLRPVLGVGNNLAEMEDYCL
jgi:uracil-DNA glycosylase family 4